MLLLGFCAVSLNNVVVVVSALELGLHLGKLMLDSIELYTSVFATLLDLTHLFLLLSEIEVHTLVLVRKLLGKSILEASHQVL